MAAMPPQSEEMPDAAQKKAPEQAGKESSHADSAEEGDQKGDDVGGLGLEEGESPEQAERQRDQEEEEQDEVEEADEAGAEEAEAEEAEAEEAEAEEAEVEEDAVEEAAAEEVEEEEEEEAEAEEDEEEEAEAEEHVPEEEGGEDEEAEEAAEEADEADGEKAMLDDGDDAPRDHFDAEAEEQEYEDVEEEAAEGPARARPHNREAEAWPALPSSRPAAPRRWTGRAAVQEPVLDEAEGEEDEEWYGEEEEEEEEELADLRAQMRQMEEENQSLRDELSQEQMRVKQLQKLQVEAAQASHREFEAKKREAAASRELEEAKAYVSKRHAFALNEKAELLKQIADLERKLQESSDRELALRLEVQEAIQARTSSSTQQEDFQKEADRWRKDAAEQATRVKAAEQRAQQLEQRKLEDKAKIKALADQLQNATAAGFVADANHADEKRLQESTKSKVLEASPAATKVSSSKGHNFRGIVNKPLEPRKPAASRPWYRRLAGFCCRRASWAVEMAQACQKQAVVAKPPQKAPKGKRAPAEKAVKSAGTFQVHPEQVDTELRQRAVLALLVVFIACLAASKLAR